MGPPASHLPLLGLREAAAHLRHQVPLLFLQVLEQQRAVRLEALLVHDRDIVSSGANATAHRGASQLVAQALSAPRMRMQLALAGEHTQRAACLLNASSDTQRWPASDTHVSDRSHCATARDKGKDHAQHGDGGQGVLALRSQRQRRHRARTAKSLRTATLTAGSCPASSGRMAAVSFTCSAAIVS